MGSMDQRLNEIFVKLIHKETEKVVIFGEQGVGKTWMAKKLSDRAVQEKCFDFSIWIFLCTMHDDRSLLESIARQMSLIGDSDEWETADEREAETRGEDDKKEKINVDKLKDLILKTFKKKKVLLVLDDEGSKMKEGEIMSNLDKLLALHDQVGPGGVVSFGVASFKVLVTTTTRSSDDGPKESTFEVKPLADSQLSSFLQERIDKTVPDTLAKAFLAKCEFLPIADIIVIAKALNHIGKLDSGAKLVESYNVMQLLSVGYHQLPSVILYDFLCTHKHFFRDYYRSVHYTELITYWILEGYFGHISSIQKAFEIGHCVVMELIDCHLLKELEAGYVMVNAKKCVSDKLGRDPRDLGFHETVTIGLATVSDDKWAGFGRITHKDGVVRTLFKDAKGKNLTTLLLDGNRFGVEVLKNLLHSNGALQVLAVFHPTLKNLPDLVLSQKKLEVFVLRGCNFLEKINSAPPFENLTVLEISGATSLTQLPDDFFMPLKKLRSLNLSDLQIKDLPKSLFELEQLWWLILKGCSRLEKVSGSLKKLVNLVHLDLSNASSLESFSDPNFHSNEKLKILNVSKTKIKTLPLLKKLKNLTHLLLTDCAALGRLRSIAPLTSLQTLDISGATKFKEFHDLSLDKVTELKIINLSNTSVELLPSHVSCPREIYLRCCLELKQLECIKSLEHLEILDLSGSTEMSKIEEGFFDSTTCLKELNLSGTKIAVLPSLSKLCNLRQLLLSRCESLQELPDLNTLTNLEVLDASNCTALTVIPEKSFEHMSRLEILNLSETKIECLPTLPSPNSLVKLLLQDCNNLKKFSSDINLPKLEELCLSHVELSGEDRVTFLKHMSCLRFLDLSETNVENLPPLSNLKNLKVLSLRGCKHLKVVPDLVTLTNLEALDLSGTAVCGLESLSNFKNIRRFHSSTENFQNLTLNALLGHTSNITQLPHGIMDLPHLQLLGLPTWKENQEDDTKESVNARRDMNPQQWMISSWPEEVEADSDKGGIFVSSAQCVELFKDPSLWETSFKQFHFLVRPLNQLYHNKEDYKYQYSMELIFRSICFQAWQFVRRPTEQVRSLEICGFQNNLASLDVILSHAAAVYITDSPFITSLSDFGAEHRKEMKVCWIERCNKLKSIVGAEKLDCTVESKEETEKSEGNLAEKLDCTVESKEETEKSEGNLPEKLDCTVESKEETEKSEGNLPEKLDCTVESKEETEISEGNLEFILVSNATNLESIVQGNMNGSLRNLKCLYLDCCPIISNVFCKSQQLENLEILEIRFCNGLKTLFQDESVKLPKLQKLHLRALPKLEKVGCVAPNLLSLQVADCPMLVTVLPPSPCLNTLHINCCEMLESVFELTQSECTLHELQELHLSGLPKMKSLGVNTPALPKDYVIRECQIREEDFHGTNTT